MKRHNHAPNNASKDAPNDTANKWHIQHSHESKPNEAEGEGITEHRPHDKTNCTGREANDQSEHATQQDALYS